jgi:FkbM family methyltransferase
VTNSIKIDFKGKNVNFWEACEFSKKNKIEHHVILEQANDQGLLIDEDKQLLIDFIKFIKVNKKKIRSQLYQDIFASFVVNDKFNKSYLEFGATNGIDLSNTYILENEFSWSGSLAEPDQNWIDDLRKNRPNSNIISKCIWSTSGKKLNFFSSNTHVLSSLDDFKYSDINSMPGNTAARVKEGKNYQVETISLNDVIFNYFDGKTPSYISIDTEGSEFEILNSFDFTKYQPIIFTIEHNFTDLQKKIDDLMKKNNYSRIFRDLTLFDAWYVHKKGMEKLI